MARQSKNQVVARYIGIDPGEAHCGWARVYLNENPDTLMIVIGTHSIADFGFSNLVDTLIPGEAAHVYVEEYRARAQGHQRFSDGRTAHLIGGIKYRCSDLDDVTLGLIPAADPETELQKYTLTPLVERLRMTFVQPGNPRWHHAFSALRVLIAGMMKDSRDHLRQIVKAQNGTMQCVQESVIFDGDLVSGVLSFPRS